MFLTGVQIQGFRGLGDVRFSLTPKTVLIGENNSGKTSVLDAIRLALRSNPAKRVLPPDEFDFAVTPQTNQFSIVLAFDSSPEHPWPEECIQQLEGVALVDDAGNYHVRLRYRATRTLSQIEERWDFLNSADEPLKPKDPVETLRRRLQSFVPLYQLEAVRDAGDQFSSRNSLWSSLLKGANIPDGERLELENELRQLNQKVLTKAPKLQRAATTISELHKILPRKDTEKVDVQALSPRLFDLLSRSQLVIGANATGQELPLRRHGQGAQAIAVFFLFKAHFEHLQEEGKAGIEPLLTLEEPEAHLHPQAARALWDTISAMPGQVLVTSHSPYFVQNVPFDCLRVVQKSDCTLIRGVESKVSIEIELSSEFDAKHPKISYSQDELRMTATELIDEQTCRALIKKAPEKVHMFRELQRRSKSILNSDVQRQLDSACRHLRGEALFSKAWVLCEGESDRLILRLALESLGLDPDPLGICLIDFKMGLAGQAAFGALARILGYPVFIFCDDDDAGKTYQKSFKTAAEVDDSKVFVVAPDLEYYLLSHSAATHVKNVALRLGCSAGDSIDSMAKVLHSANTRFPWYLREELVNAGKSLPVEPDLAEFLRKVAAAARG